MKKLIVIIIDLLWTIQNLKKIPSCSWFFSIPPNTMLHINMSNTVKVVLSCIALGFRKEKNTGVFLGSIYLSIHLCLCLRHSKALQLLSSGQWGGWKVLQLACSPTAGQYFYRLRLQCMHSNMSSFPLPPLTPKLKTLHWLSFCRVSHNLQSICNQPLGKLFTKEPLFFS